MACGLALAAWRAKRASSLAVSSRARRQEPQWLVWKETARHETLYISGQRSLLYTLRARARWRRGASLSLSLSRSHLKSPYRCFLLFFFALSLCPLLIRVEIISRVSVDLHSGSQLARPMFSFQRDNLRRAFVLSSASPFPLWGFFLSRNYVTLVWAKLVLRVCVYTVHC